jgi:hypothetical protein
MSFVVRCGSSNPVADMVETGLLIIPILIQGLGSEEMEKRAEK